MVFASILPVRKPGAQRAEWDKADAKLLERRQDLAFRPSIPEGILALDCRDGLDGMRAADRPGGGLGQAEVLDFALGDQLPDRPSHVLDRHVRVDAVLIEDIDAIGSQALQGEPQRPP